MNTNTKGGGKVSGKDISAPDQPEKNTKDKVHTRGGGPVSGKDVGDSNQSEGEGKNQEGLRTPLSAQGR